MRMLEPMVATRASVDSFRDDLVRWLRHNKRDFPWRRRSLSPWQILLLEMCLHRTKAEQVARVADELLIRGKTPDSFLGNSKGLAPVLASLGLHWRAEEYRLRGGIR